MIINQLILLVILGTVSALPLSRMSMQRTVNQFNPNENTMQMLRMVVGNAKQTMQSAFTEKFQNGGFQTNIPTQQRKPVFSSQQFQRPTFLHNGMRSMSQPKQGQQQIQQAPEPVQQYGQQQMPQAPEPVQQYGQPQMSQAPEPVQQFSKPQMPQAPEPAQHSFQQQSLPQLQWFHPEMIIPPVAPLQQITPQQAPFQQFSSHQSPIHQNFRRQQMSPQQSFQPPTAQRLNTMPQQMHSQQQFGRQFSSSLQQRFQPPMRSQFPPQVQQPIQQNTASQFFHPRTTPNSAMGAIGMPMGLGAMPLGGFGGYQGGRRG